MRIATFPPAYCAACHCQKGDKKHVDFEAYYDGPVIAQQVGEGLAHNQPVDDLIICEDCLGSAATLIGWIHNKSMRRENFELGRAIEEKDEHIEELRKVISDLEHTLGITLSGKVRRGRGRPQYRVPEGLEDKIIKNEEQVA